MHHIPDYLMPDWKKVFEDKNFEHLLQRVKEEYTNHPEEKQFLVPIHAMCNRLMERTTENIALCTEAAPEIRDHNAYMDTMRELVSAYKALGNKEEMLRVYKLMMERQPHTFYELHIAELYEEMGNTEEAMFYYALDAEEGDDDKVFEKIIAYYEKKKEYNKAYEYLEKLARLNTGDPPFHWCEAGRMKALAGENEEAMFLFKMVTRLDPEMASPYYFMGQILQNEGDIYRAMDNYYKALALNPNYAEAYNNLGVIQYYEEGDIKAAIAFMEKALETGVKGSTQQTLYMNLARLYAKIADYDKEEYYRQLFVNYVFSIDDEDDDEEYDEDDEDYDEDEEDYDEDEEDYDEDEEDYDEDEEDYDEDEEED